jgi:hypothetical protein
MKRAASAAITAVVLVLLSGCVGPSGRRRGQRHQGKIETSVSWLIGQLSARAEDEGKSVPVRMRVRQVASGYMQLVCTEEAGSRILLYAYYEKGGKLLEGIYFCYTAAAPKEPEPGAAPGPRIVWTTKAPSGQGGPSEYERYLFRRGVLVRAEWYRARESTPFRIVERDPRGIETRIVSVQEGGVQHEEIIGASGFPILKKMFKDGNYVRSTHLSGPFERLAAEKVAAGRNISGSLLPNYMYFRAARFDFVLIVDDAWNVRRLSGRRAVRLHGRARQHG